MAKVVYDGPAHAVDINAEGGYIHAERGVPVEVPADLARSLLEQGWKPADAQAEEIAFHLTPDESPPTLPAPSDEQEKPADPAAEPASTVTQED